MLYTENLEQYKTKKGNYRINNRTYRKEICKICRKECLCRFDTIGNYCNTKCSGQKTEEHKQKISISLSGRKLSKEHKEKIIRNGKLHKEETKRKISESQSGEKNHMYGIIHTEETRQKMSKNRKGKCCNEKHPNWKGGISKEPYCYLWKKDLKEYIKKLDNYKCMNPNCNCENINLVIHHIDYNKKNCDTSNLISICRSSNSKANKNRDYWENLYKEMIIKRSKNNE